MEKQEKQKLKDMPAKGKRGGNWHFRRSGTKRRMMRKRF